MKKNIKVEILGLGYIGLPTAALMASKYLKVLGVDIKKDVVDTINRGDIHIIEPELDKLVKEVVKSGAMRVSQTPEQADVFIIAVPTPIRENNLPDISYVQSAIEMILPYLQPDNLLIIESTSPVGTTGKMAELIFQKRPELKNNLYMAYCPERVLPGNIIYELEHNDRVIGGIDNESTERAIDFYQNFVKGKLYPTNAKTAEMVKLVENSSRDVQIAFANELSMISDKAGIDVWELIELANKHPRVNILRPGPGVGGHCIAVDPWFIVSEFSQEARLIKTAREVNIYKTEWIIEKIKNEALQFELIHNKKPLIAAMGLAYKPDIDDLRASPSLYVTRNLKMLGFHIIVVEPNIKHFEEFELADPGHAVEKADIIVFLVGHKEFKNIKIPAGKTVLDFVNVHQ